MTLNDLKCYKARLIMPLICNVLFVMRYLKTVPKGAKSFSDTHYDVVFSVTVMTIVEMISDFTGWRF